MVFFENMEAFLLTSGIILTVIGLGFFLRLDWKRYGILFLTSASIGAFLCALFIFFGFYEFPFRSLPNVSPMPLPHIVTFFPLYVMIGVRYSPEKWGWKIPFYWAMVHIGVFSEALILQFTDLVIYKNKWDLWDTYTLWWIYLLVFEWVGGLIIPRYLRKPLNPETLRFGKIGWFILHFILIATIFLAGFYLGWKS